MQKRFKISIGKDCTYTVESVGQSGSSCQQNMEAIMLTLGDAPQKEGNKPEFYDPDGCQPVTIEGM